MRSASKVELIRLWQDPDFSGTYLVTLFSSVFYIVSGDVVKILNFTTSQDTM